MDDAALPLARLPVTGMQTCHLRNLDDDGRDNLNLWILRRLDGALDRAALERALDELVARHEALRTTFRRVDGGFEQIVWDRGRWPLEEVDLTAAPETLDACVQEFVFAAGPVLDAPLVAARAFRSGPSAWLLVLRVHHVVVDFSSCAIIGSELEHLYLDAVAGRSPTLPPVAMQAGEHYASEAREPDAAKAAYWKRCFDGTPAVSWRRFGAPANGYDGWAYLSLAPISPDRAQRLDRLAREQRAARAAALAAAALAAIVDEGDQQLMLLVVRSNRDHPRLNRVVGFLADTLPVPVAVGGDPSFRELIARTQRAWVASLAHALPLRQVTTLAGIDVRPGYPLGDVVFNYFGSPSSANGDGDPSRLLRAVETTFSLSQRVLPEVVAAPWELRAWEQDAHIQMGFGTLDHQARTPAFAALSQRLRAVLARVVEQPDAPLSTLLA